MCWRSRSFPARCILYLYPQILKGNMTIVKKLWLLSDVYIIFFLLKKKIFDAFLLIFSRTVVRSHRSREGEGDLACIEKNREEEALFAQKLQFSYHFDKVPLSFIPFLRLSRKVFSDSNNHGQPQAASIVESWQLLHWGDLNPCIISWMSCNLHWSKDYLTLLLNTG